jgi:RNA polymerase primary sigma factor
MSDKNKFQEMLKDILEVARVQGNVLTMEEIKSLFGDIELNDNQYEHIFAYLAAHHIKIHGYVGTISEYSKALEDENKETDENIEELTEVEATDVDSIDELKLSSKVKSTEIDSIYLRMYLEDLNAIKESTPEEEEDLIHKIINDNDVAKSRYIEINLKNVIDIAKEYVNKGLTLEDLIQEGNIGLITGVDQLSSLSLSVANGKVMVMDYVRRFIEAAIEDHNDVNSFANTVIQKTKYLNEAANELAEDLGREADITELANYTKLSVQEIKDVLNMSVDVVKVGVSHNHHNH